MPRIGRNSGNSSKEGARGGNSVPKNMRGHKLAQRLPHLSPLVDGTLSSSTRGIGVTKHQTNIFSVAGDYNYKVPPGVDTLTITMYGGGGGGGASTETRGGGKTGAGAGGGAKVTVVVNEIAPRTVLSFTVGTGGVGGSALQSYANNGGDTTFTHLGVNYVAGGGCGGARADNATGTGGSGGIGSGSGATIVHGNTGHKGIAGDKTGSGGVSRAGYGSYGQGGSGGHVDTALPGVSGVAGAVVIT